MGVLMNDGMGLADFRFKKAWRFAAQCRCRGRQGCGFKKRALVCACPVGGWMVWVCCCGDWVCKSCSFDETSDAFFQFEPHVYFFEFEQDLRILAPETQFPQASQCPFFSTGHAIFLFCLMTSIICPILALFLLRAWPFPRSPPPLPHRATRLTMAEGRAISSNREATNKHQQDPLAVLLTKVERTLQQLAMLEAEEQKSRPAKTFSPPPAPPQPPARQAATSAFAFSPQHHNNKARVHPIEEPVSYMSPRNAND